MKKIYHILFFIFFLAGCFEDESSMQIEGLSPIVIENVKLNDYISIYMGDTLKIEPLVYCEGISDEKLSFEWKLFGGTITPTELGTNMYLNAKVVAPPFSNYYTLRFTIKDEISGICRIETFGVKVLSPFGEGLLIGDISENGSTSDLSLIMSKQFSSQIPSTNNQIKIRRNIWSEGNGMELTGEIYDVVTTSYGTNRSATVLTTDGIYRADHYDYVNLSYEFDKNLFSVIPPHIGTGYSSGKFVIYSPTKHEIMSANGKITARSTQHNNRKYNYTLYAPKVLDYNIKFMYAPTYHPVYAYDKLGNQMLFCDYSKMWKAKDQTTNGDFNVNDLSDYDGFFLGETSQGVTLLAKQKSTNAYKGLIMKKSKSDIADYAQSIFDFSSATEIEKAKYFDLNVLEDVVYYATDKIVYTTPTVNIYSQEQWRVEDEVNEIITGIKIYNWIGGNRDESDDMDGKITKGSQNRLLLITTYNTLTKEGRVTAVPIVTINIGGLEQDKQFHTVLRGFRRITGVYKQNI